MIAPNRVHKRYDVIRINYIHVQLIFSVRRNFYAAIVCDPMRQIK